MHGQAIGLLTKFTMQMIIRSYIVFSGSHKALNSVQIFRVRNHQDWNYQK